MEIREYASRVGAWVEGHGGYFPPLANLARLTEEAGELARIMGALYGPKTPKPGERPGEMRDEIGDLLFVVAVLANQTGVDLEEAAAGALTKAALRDARRFTPNS